MNDIDVLRRLRPEVADPDPLVLARARLTLRDRGHTGRFLGRRQVLTNPTTAKPSPAQSPGTILTWTSVSTRTTTTPPPTR